MVDALEDCQFGGQVLHVLSATAPGGAEYLPAAQSVHVAVPVIILYFPPAHAVHAKPFAPVYPALHMHWVETVLACAELEPAGQSVHNAVPVPALKVPATQGRHGPLLAPVCPTLHAQLL